MLAGQGFKAVYNLKGGIRGWNGLKAAGPIEIGMVHMTGDFLTKIFEGAYKNAPKWEKEMNTFVKSKGKQVKKTYFFYTTCPKCAKFYGKNYVIAVSEVE